MDITTLTVDVPCPNHAAPLRRRPLPVPLVIRTLAGGGFRLGAHHARSLQA